MGRLRARAGHRRTRRARSLVAAVGRSAGLRVEAAAAEGVPLQEILLIEAIRDLGRPPEPGVYWSRLSASAHTRGRAQAKDVVRSLLGGAESWGRRTE